MADHIADHDPDAAARQLEHVVPVAAHLLARGEIPRRDVHSDHVGKPLGQEAALEHHRHVVLVLELREQPRALDRRRRSRGSHLQHRDVVLAERPRSERAHVKHADQFALDDQRDAQQRRDSFLAQDRIQDIGVIDVGDEDRDALGRNATGEALAQREPHALLDLLLDPIGGARDELIRVRFVQQNRDCVHLQRLLDADQQFVEKRFERQFGQLGSLKR